MYLLETILILILIVLGSYTIYNFLLDRINLSKNLITVIFLYLLEIIFVLLSHNSIFYLFLDLPAFIGYMINRKKESIILFLVTALYSQMILNISIYYSVVYFISLTLLTLIPVEKKYYYLLFVKIFINSYLYFLYIDSSEIAILFLLALFLLFDLLIKLTISFIKTHNYTEKDEDLVYKIAHEVKNPIAVCKGYLDMLDVDDKEKINKYIPIIKKEMNRSLNIMDSFLELKRLTINKDLMDLTMLLDDVKETMSIVLKNKTKLSIPRINDEIIIEGDYDKLKQVLINLIKNSYEADSKMIKISLRKSNSYIKIKITDDGKGISSEDLKNIGKPFYTTKVTGTGIGVSLSKEILKLHNGKLIYTSEVDVGTETTLILPVKYYF